VPFGFTGGLYDSDTGLVHLGYRELTHSLANGQPKTHFCLAVEIVTLWVCVE